jgi:hypothetical protein
MNAVQWTGTAMLALAALVACLDLAASLLPGLLTPRSPG